jgi:hypothetical protein
MGPFRRAGGGYRDVHHSKEALTGLGSFWFGRGGRRRGCGGSGHAARGPGRGRLRGGTSGGGIPVALGGRARLCRRGIL